MIKLTEDEFKAIKKHLKIASIKSTAYTMKRSQSCVARIKASKDYAEYVNLVKLEHTAQKPRKPLSIQIYEAKIEELMAVKSKGRLGAYKAVCQRLDELMK